MKDEGGGQAALRRVAAMSPRGASRGSPAAAGPPNKPVPRSRAGKSRAGTM